MIKMGRTEAPQGSSYDELQALEQIEEEFYNSKNVHYYIFGDVCPNTLLDDIVSKYYKTSRTNSSYLFYEKFSKPTPQDIATFPPFQGSVNFVRENLLARISIDDINLREKAKKYIREYFQNINLSSTQIFNRLAVLVFQLNKLLMYWTHMIYYGMPSDNDALLLTILDSPESPTSTSLSSLSFKSKHLFHTTLSIPSSFPKYK